MPHQIKPLLHLVEMPMPTTQKTMVISQNSDSMNLCSVTPANAASEGVTQPIPAPMSTEGSKVNTSNRPYQTHVNVTLEGITPKTDMMPLLHITTTISESASTGSAVTLVNDAVTPATDLHINSNVVLDLTVNHDNSTMQPEPPVPNSTADNSFIMLANGGEFDFPALSSEDEYGNKAPLTSPSPSHNPKGGSEMCITEEEDDAVSALLSLSKSMPSDNIQEDLITMNFSPFTKLQWMQHQSQYI